MKFIHSTFLALVITILVVSISSKAKKSHLKSRKSLNKQIVRDTTNFGQDINTVIRKTPTVYYDNSFAYPQINEYPKVTYFGNSNTSSLPNPGGYPKSPEMVNPTILFHSVEPISTVETMPVHLGNKNISNEITSYDRNTGSIEKHQVNHSIPIMGDVQHVRNLTHETIRPLDLQYRRFRKPTSIVHENPDLDYNASLDTRFNRR